MQVLYHGSRPGFQHGQLLLDCVYIFGVIAISVQILYAIDLADWSHIQGALRHVPIMDVFWVDASLFEEAPALSLGLDWSYLITT